MSNVSRRSVAKGAAWTIPAIAVATSAPALAASVQGTITTAFSTSDACGAPGTERDVFVTLTATTSFALTSDVVISVSSSATARAHGTPATSTGTVTCTTAECDSFTWTIPAGTTIPASGSTALALTWHFVEDTANPTTVSANVAQGAASFTNPSTSTAAGWTGAGGCTSTSQI